MKKLNRYLFYILTLFFIVSSNKSLIASNLVDLELNYDGKIHKYLAQEISININNNKIKSYDIQPVILDSRTLVPLRLISENMGASIFWDEKDKKIFITKEDDNLVFTINSLELIKNKNEKIDLDVAPKIINNYTMVPIRAVSQAFDCTVKWDSINRVVNIYEKDFDISTVTNNNVKKDGIKLLWDQIDNSKANDKEIKRKSIDGLDVLSPTWFVISNNEGDILDKGSLEYAKWAKNEGYELWGLVSNNFDPIITHNTLSNLEIRNKIINKLCEMADKYGLDGINIDFESVAKEDGDYYLQFIKEATLKFKQKGLTVSVDMYIPSPWTKHYQMEEVGKIVDYVIIMAYDEHYRGSKESGSVSSIGWVDKAMQDTIKLVDNNKIIMGVPFYTRIWFETRQEDGNIEVTSQALTMQQAYDLLTQNNAKIVWLEEVGQYYGEYVENGITKKIWLEDERSIEERMKISRKYDLKGIACWKRGFEKEEVWDVINDYYE